MDVVLWPAWGAFLGAVALVASYIHPLVAPAFLILAPYALKEPRIPVPAAIMAASIVVYLLLPFPDWPIVMAAQVLPRAASVVLVWIARPAANESLPNVTSVGAVLAILTGLVAAWNAGWYAWFMLAATLMTVRLVMLASYKSRGGIRSESLAWVRQILEIAILLIAQLRVSSR